MIETGRYTSVLFCLQFRISIYASGPCSCRDLTDETYIFEPYCKSVRLPPQLRRTPTSHAARQQWWAAVLLQSPWKGPSVCVVYASHYYYSAASLILLLHHSGAKHKIYQKTILKNCTQDRIVIH